MGIRKKIVILATVGIGGVTALYAPAALGRVGDLPEIVDQFRSGSGRADSKREKLLGKLAKYEDRLLDGETGGEIPVIGDTESAADRISLASALTDRESGSDNSADAPAVIGDLPADSELASETPDKSQQLNPPSAASLGVAGDEPFHVEAVSSIENSNDPAIEPGVKESNQDRLIAELIKNRYKIKSLEQQLQAVRNQQQLDHEVESLGGDQKELDRDESHKIEQLNHEIARLKRESGYGDQLKADLTSALERIEQLKSQLESNGSRMVVAQRSSAADEQEKLELARQNKELTEALSAKTGELKLIKQREIDNSNDRDWIEKLQNELESAKNEAAELKRQNKELAFNKEEFEQTQSVLEKRNQEVSKLSEELARVGSQGKQIDQLKNERDKLSAKLTDLEKNSKSKAKLEADLEAVIKRGDTVAREKKEIESRLAALTEEAAKTAEENSALEKNVAELKAVAAGVDQRLALAAEEARVCSESLSKKTEVTAKVPDLVKKLVETKNELMLREAEIQSFNSADSAAAAKAVPAQPRASLAAPPRQPEAAPAARIAPVSVPVPVPALAPAPSDVMVIQISSDKANLRSGPGEEYAPVMQVEKGMRLTVETQEGEWYRVITPTGNRAYVRQDVVNGNGRRAPSAASAPRQSAANSVHQRPKVVSDDSLLVPFDGGAPAAGSSVDDEETRAFENLKKELMSKSRPR